MQRREASISRDKQSPALACLQDHQIFIPLDRQEGPGRSTEEGESLLDKVSDTGLAFETGGNAYWQESQGPDDTVGVAGLSIQSNVSGPKSEHKTQLATHRHSH